VTVTGAGSCPCHPHINDAIAAHQQIVETQARALGTRPGRDGYDDVISDGMLALWRALTSYDGTGEGLDTWLTRRVRFRMIDGLRSRTGRGSAARPATHTLLDADLQPVDFEADRIHDAVDARAETVEIYLLAATIDPRLPKVLRLLGDGHSRTEIALQIGVSRTRIWQLTSLLTTQLTQRASA
jgi:RNA polymerase sigma factor (sigma-70 family)